MIVSDSPTVMSGDYYDATGDYRGVQNAMKYGETFALADDQSISDTSDHDYTTAAQTDGHNVEGRESTILAKSTLDQNGTISVYGHPIDSSDKVLLYTSAGNLTAGSTIVIGSGAGGTGASGYIQVEALKGPWFKITVRFTASVSPGSGLLNIDLYAA